VSENPYAPPRSRVEDAAPAQIQMERPAQVMAAIWLAAIGYGLGLIVIVLTWDYYSRLQTLAAFIGSQFFSFSILIWLYYKIYVGRNWARITLLVFSLLGGFMTATTVVMDLLAAAPTIAKIQMFVGLGLNAIVIWLLFFSPGRYWFQRSSGV